jgi:hypothetical protein
MVGSRSNGSDSLLPRLHRKAVCIVVVATSVIHKILRTIHDDDQITGTTHIYISEYSIDHPLPTCQQCTRARARHAWAMRIHSLEEARLGSRARRLYTCPLLLGPDGGSRSSRRGFAAPLPDVSARRPPT